MKLNIHPLLSASCKTHIIIPYGIYGGAEVYLFNHLKDVDPSLVCFVFLAPNNALQQKLQPKFRCLNIAPNRLYESLKLKASRIVFYNSKMVYNILSKMKYSCEDLEIIEIVHSSMRWNDSMHGSSRAAVDTTFAVSSVVADQWRLPAPYYVLPPVIDKSRFSPSLRVKQDKFTIGTVARISPEKNLRKIVDIAEHLDDNFQFIIVGKDGGSKRELVNYIVAKKLTHRILVKDYRDDIEQEYATFDAFLLTSTIEGTPITILEAQAMNIPIIAPDVGAISTMTTDLDVLYSPTAKSTEIASKLRLLSSRSSTQSSWQSPDAKDDISQRIYTFVTSTKVQPGVPNDYSFIKRDKAKFLTPISIIIPFYNKKSYLSKCLASLKKQTYNPSKLIEVIIGDDGSTEDIQDILQEYTTIFSNVVYVRQEDEGYRLSRIRNLAVKQASSSIVAVVDPDLVLSPTAIEHFMEWFEHNPNTSFSMIGYLQYVQDISVSEIIEGSFINNASFSTSRGTDGDDYRRPVFEKTENLLQALDAYACYTGGWCVFRKDDFERIQGFDEEFIHYGGEDIEFGYKINQLGPIIPSLDSIAYHLDHTSSKTTKTFDSHILLCKKVPIFRQKLKSTWLQYLLQAKVSIIMPVYNGEKYLRAAIDSCLNQTWPNIELILVNDGSTDETLNIMKSYSTDDRVVIIDQANLKLPAALNAGFKKATGVYLTWTSCDNIYAPSAIEFLVNHISEASPFIFSDWSAIDANSTLFRRYNLSATTMQTLLKYNGIGPFFMYTRQVYQSIGEYDDAGFLVEDYEYWLRISRKFNIKHIPSLDLYFYRFHKDTLTTQKQSDVRHRTTELLKSYNSTLGIIPTDPIDSYIQKGNHLRRNEYYNPHLMFKSVFILSPYEAQTRTFQGMQIIPISSANDLIEAVSKYQIDIVRTYGGYGRASELLIEAKKHGLNIPTVLSLHDKRINYMNEDIHVIDHIICVSSAVAQPAITTRNVPAEKITIIPNRVDLNVFRKVEPISRFSNHAYKILHVARQSPEKNARTLFEALSILGEEYCCIAIGAFDDIKTYTKWLQDYKIAHRVEMIASIANNELPAYYSWANCLCVPSHSEGFGMVFIESLACQTPVITSNIAPMNEYMQHGISGHLVDEYTDATKLAEAIKTVCTNVAYAESLSLHGQSVVAKFSKPLIDLEEARFYRKIIT